MRVTMDMGVSAKAFSSKCEATLTKVGNGSRKALIAALDEIYDNSQNQVPRDTDTLASSGFYEVTGDYKTGWTGTIGYGGPVNPVNPKTGQRASEYMVAVHEDLTAHHPIGKAKFLEDPVREYAAEKFPRTVIRHLEPILSE